MSTDLLAVASPDGLLQTINPSWHRVLGFTPDELRTRPYIDLVHPDDLEATRAGLMALLDPDISTTRFDCRVRCRDGSFRFLSWRLRMSAARDEVFCIARDITDLKQAEHELRRAARYSRSLIEASLDPLVTISADGTIMDVNAATEDATGIGRDALIGSDFSSYFTEPDMARAGYQQVFSQGHVTDYPLAIRHVDGTITDVLYNATVYHDENGNVAGVFAAARDITDLKEAEAEVSRVARYSRSLIEASLDPLVTISADGTIMDVNAATEDATGIGRDTLIGSDFSSYFTEPDMARAGYQQVFSQGHVTDYPLAIRHVDGTITDVLYNATVYHDENGNVAGVFAAARDITDLKEAEAEVSRVARYSRSLIEASLDPLVTISADGTIMDVNAATEDATGIGRDTLIGSDFSSYFTEPDMARAGYQQVFSQGHVTDYPLAIRHVDGTITDVLYNATVYHDENGNVAGVFAAARDITDLKEAEAALAAEAQLRLAIDNSAIGICLVARDGRFIRVNATLCTMLGYDPESLLRLSWRDITHPDDIETGRQQVEDLLAGRQRSFRILKRYLAADGRVIWGDLSVAAVPNEDGTVRHMIAQIVDVTDRVTAEEELIHLATHDPLTGLANRAALGDEITRALRSAARSNGFTAVLMLDLDRFKNVNDSLGHTAGDELLVAAARRIEACVRGGDLVARPGGDEFVIVMRELSDPTEAIRAAWRIVVGMRAPFRAHGAELSATASVGVAVASSSSVADDLLREADTAMYLAKSEGRDRVTVFNEDLRVAATFRLSTESLLRRAREKNELVVWYQPEIDLKTGSMIAVEALLRWHHPDGELYTADRFIDIAEETGLILGIGEWVIRTVCAQAAEWATARPDRPLTVRLNLSTLQVAEDGLLWAIDDALAASGVDPQRLCIEITETALLRETPTVHANLTGVRQRGIRVAVDDFGTGYASLAYLREYPVDVLKIDRTFVADLMTSARSRQLITGIVSLSQALGMTVTAEGVEFPEQARALRELGCPAAQGYLYSRAVPPETITSLIDVAFPSD